jgi:hypothetical protein
LVKDKAPADDQDESGTTTASSAPPSPPPNCGGKGPSIKEASAKSSKAVVEIPKNLKELLATGLLDGQRVKYIMKKGKVMHACRHAPLS